MAAAFAIAGLVLMVLALVRFARNENGNKPWVRVETCGVAVGNGRDRRYISVTDIRQIRIAPLWDVYPFDDCWLLDGSTLGMVSFLNREKGAEVALAYLERVLPNFSAAQSVKKANDESMFEEPVVVWGAP